MNFSYRTKGIATTNINMIIYYPKKIIKMKKNKTKQKYGTMF